MSTQVKALPKIKIDFNSYGYEKVKNLEQEAKKQYDILKDIADTILGIDQVSMPRFLKANPKNYIVTTYANLYLQDYPEHLNHVTLVKSQTNIDIIALEQAHRRYNDAVNELADHKPTITSKGFTSNIKKSAFNIYLKEEHRAKYEALNNLLDCVEVLTQWYGNRNNINFIRHYSDLQFDGLGIKINKTRFS